MTNLSDDPEFAANDNVDWQNPEEIAVPTDLPRPSIWRILVMPVQPKKVSKGGIVLPSMAQDAEGHLQIIGKVAALGPLAYRSWKFAAGPQAHTMHGDFIAGIHYEDTVKECGGGHFPRLIRRFFLAL